MPVNAWPRLPAAGLAAFAAACAPAASDIVAPAPPAYGDAVQRRAANALEELDPPCPPRAVVPNCSALHRLVIDYGRLRAKLRAVRDE